MDKVLSVILNEHNLYFFITECNAGLTDSHIIVFNSEECNSLSAYATTALNEIKKYLEQHQNLSRIFIVSNMSGVLALDSEDNLLSEFSDSRNVDFEESAASLTELLNFGIEEDYALCRYHHFASINSPLLLKIKKITTLSGYITYSLTGNFYLGYSECSKLFPFCSENKNYKKEFIASLINENLPFNEFLSLLPNPCSMHNSENFISNGDKTTTVLPSQSLIGIVLQNSDNLYLYLGSKSVLGTKLEKPLQRPHRECQCLVTPEGHDACCIENPNGDADLNSYLDLLAEAAALISGNEIDYKKTAELKNDLIQKALDEDDFESNLIVYNQTARDPFSFMDEGRPLLIRHPDSKLKLCDLITSHFLSMMVPLKLALRILKSEGAVLNEINLSGNSYIIIPKLQKLCADLFELPVSVKPHLAELKDIYRYTFDNKENCLTLSESERIEPEDKGVKRAKRYLERYVLCLGLERQAVKSFIK